ncbi:phage I-like protein [Agrobacterium vitis]|nr:phage I-like protein [Agrobacterium vitis]MBE1439835.1 phage I-like protein [Agrobacterium vitis]
MKNRTAYHLIALHSADGIAPEWLHLLPATSFKGVDGRGPYAAPDADALIGLFNSEGRKLPVDENHAIDLAGKSGHPSPARGWIVELQSRDDGVWGRVEWTEEGQSLVAGKSYGYLSPVFLHSVAKPYRVDKLLRVALTNDPNLDFLTSLHSRQETEMLEELRKALGLPDTATEADVLATVASTHAANQANAALMAKIREASGLDANVSGDALVTALQSRGKATATEAENADLKTQLVSLQTQLTSLVTNMARDKAETTIEAAIAGGKIVPALREHMVSRHMKTPAEVEAEIALMPSLNAGGLGGRKLSSEGDTATAEEIQVASMMGVDPEAFKKEHKALFGREV